MSFSPVPNYVFSGVTEITHAFLRSIGVSFLMLDLDNTIARYSDEALPVHVLRWADELRNSGVTLFIVSNNRKNTRVKAMSKALNAEYIYSAGKPSSKGVLAALAKTGFPRKASALAGDQVYTDVLAANSAGVISIAVPPLDKKNPLFAVRYALELPFRVMCANKML